MAAIGTSRYFDAAQYFGRFRGEADIKRGFMSTRPSHLERKFVSLYNGARSLAGERSWRRQERAGVRLRLWF
jgi:hypothetical protein